MVTVVFQLSTNNERFSLTETDFRVNAGKFDAIFSCRCRKEYVLDDTDESNDVFGVFQRYSDFLNEFRRTSVQDVLTESRPHEQMLR